MMKSRSFGVVGTIAAIAAGVTLIAGPAAAGDAKTKFRASKLSHSCKHVDNVSVHVKLTHAVPHAKYRIQGTIQNSPAVIAKNFKIKKSPTYKHRLVLAAFNGDVPTTKSTVYFTLYHVRKNTNTQLTFSYPPRTLPACTK